MSSFIGADPTELDALAQRFVVSSQSLQNVRVGITRTLLAAQWHGPEADRFRSDWSNQWAPSIARAASSLDACSSYLRAKAAQQVKASSAASLTGLVSIGQGMVGSGFGPTAGMMLGLLSLASPILAADQKLVQSQMGKSPAEQAAWWSSLSPTEQSQLEALAPASLLALRGLPSSARKQVSAAMAREMDSSIPVKRSTMSVSAQAGEVVVGGGNLKFVQTTNADGSVSVQVGGKVYGGVGVQWDGTAAGASASATAGVGDAATYTFANMAQAKAFERGLLHAATPQLGWQDIGYLPVFGTGPAAVLSTQVAQYLGGYKGDLTSNVVSGTLSDKASVSVGPGYGAMDGATASIQAGASISHDTVQDTTTATVSASGSGYAGMGPFAGAASGDVSAAVTWGPDNQMSNFTLSGKFTAEGTVTDLPGVVSQLAPPPDLQGAAGSFKMTVDLSNPQNAAAAARLVEDLQTGNSAGATQAYHQLYDASTVVVEKGTSSGHQAGVGFGVGSVSVSDTNVSYNSIYVKPPNGDYVAVQPQ